MAKTIVTGDQYMSIDGKLEEIKRQLRQKNGYPFDVNALEAVLQRATEGDFGHIVNLDANPLTPNGWSINPKDQIKSVVRSPLNLSKVQIGLHLSEEQKGGAVLGHDLKKALEGKPVMSAVLLDYYLAHPELIPESWKGKAVFFWGTIYRGSYGDLYVRCLFWNGGGWYWFYYWLVDGFGGQDPSAVLAS